MELASFWTGFAEWWGTINWGDAPGWTGAVLTSASLFLAVSLMARDKKVERQAEAKRIVVRERVLTTVDAWTLEVTVYNANPHPLPIVTLLRQGDLIWHRRFFESANGDPAIPPGTEGQVSVPYERPIEDRFYMLHFTDSQGTEWYRGLASRRILQPWRVKWWLLRDRRAAWRDRTQRWAARVRSDRSQTIRKITSWWTRDQGGPSDSA